MASSSSFPLCRRQRLRPSLLLAVAALLFLRVHEAAACYTSIFSFGDSLDDTGNFGDDSWHIPYGETYFHHPAGRFSDGRIINDFMAQAMGLPFLQPYLLRSGDHDVRSFRRGSCFAVAGATALDNSFFSSRGIDVNWTNYSLSVQLGWFKELIPTLCTSASDCKNFLSNSLLLMGGFGGGNDYTHSFLSGRDANEIKTYMPYVINAITSAVTELIEFGVRTVVVPGSFPAGCWPSYLTYFENESRKEDSDKKTGCIKWMNEFMENHNELLQVELHKLRQLHPEATIIYADYYNAASRFFQAPQQFGFEADPLVSCCGVGGRYNFNESVVCGNDNATWCKDPSKSISWDGRHLTEAAYRLIFEGLLGQYTTPSISKLCPHINMKNVPPIQQDYLM